MTLKNQTEFKDDYKWNKMSKFGGCKAIIQVAIDELEKIEPFNEETSK
jgi:hypothetical protein